VLFHTQRREVAGWSVVRVIGEVDLASAPSMRAALRALPADASVAVDLSDCSLIDSVGIGLLIGGARRVRDAGGRMVVVAPRGGLVRRMLDICRVDAVLDVASSSDAFASLAPAEPALQAPGVQESPAR
jgi:anti-sigma B factor antagonist